MNEEQKQNDAGPPVLAEQEEKALAKVPEINFENGQLIPKTFADAWYLCRLIARSGLVPEDKRTPEKILVAWQYGQSIGLDLFASIQNVAVIGGVPSVWGDSMKGVVDGSGTCEEFLELEWGSIKDKDFKAICIAKKKGQGKQIDIAAMIAKEGGHLSSESENTLKASGYYLNRYTYQDAIDAGYSTKKGAWQTNPKRMCKLRARGFTLRDGFSGLLKGMRTIEEMKDASSEELVEQTDGSFAPAEEVAQDLEAKVKGDGLDVSQAKETPQEPPPDKEPDPDDDQPSFVFDPNLAKAADMTGIKDGGMIDARLYRRFWDTFDHYFGKNKEAETYFGDALVNLVIETKGHPEHVMRGALDNFAAFIKLCVERFGDVPTGPAGQPSATDELSKEMEELDKQDGGLGDLDTAGEPDDEDLQSHQLSHQFNGCFKAYCEKLKIGGQDRVNLQVECNQFVFILEKKGQAKKEIYRKAIEDFGAFVAMMEMEKNRPPEPTEFNAYKNKRNAAVVDAYIEEHAAAFKADANREAELRHWYKRRFADKIFPFDRKQKSADGQDIDLGSRPPELGDKEDPTIDTDTQPTELKGAAAGEKYHELKDQIRQLEKEEPELMAMAKKNKQIDHPITIEGCDWIIEEFYELKQKRDLELDAMNGTAHL